MTGILKSFIQNQINKANLKRTATAGQQTSSQGVTQTTPQDTKGNYVVTNSGGGITVVSPTGNVVPSPKVVPSRNNGGGGSSSSGIPTPAATIEQQNTFNALDLPPPINQGTVTKATSNVGLGNAVSYFRQNIGRESAVNLIKGTGQVAVGGIVNRVKNQSAKEKAQREAQIIKEQQNLQTGTRTTSLYGGTIQTYQGNQYTDAEVVKLGTSQKVSEAAVINELSRRDAVRYGDEYNTFINTKVPDIQANAQTEYQTKYDEYNAMVQAGKVSAKDANKALELDANIINTNITKQLEQETKGWTDSRGIEFQKESNVRLNKISDKIKISKTLAIAPLIVLGGAAVGAAGVAIAGTSALASTLVTTAGYVGTGASIVGTGSSLLSSYKTGTLNAGRVGAVILPQLLFVGGAIGGAKITGKAINNYNINKLNGALDRASLEVVNPKAITKDFQITTLKIPENAQVEILGKLRGGSSIRVVEYSKENIKGANADDVKTIKKLLPETKAKFVEVIDSYGNVIQRIAVGEIKVGTGKKAYRENVLQGSAGLKVGENTFVMDTIGLRAPEGKGFTEVSKTREVIKPNQAKYFMEDNALKRLVSAKSFSFEGMKIKAPEGKQITFKNLQEVVNSDKFNKTPFAKSKSAEVQRVTEIRMDNAIFGVEGGENTLGWELKQIKFQTEGGKAITNKIPKPFEFTREPSTKAMKPFDVTKDLNVKSFEQAKGKTNQILEQLKKQQSTGLDIGQIPSFDFTPQIKTAVKSGVTKVITAKKNPFLFGGINGFKQQSIDLKPIQLKSLSDNSFLNTNKILKPVVINKDKNKGRNSYGGGNTNIGILTTAQVDKLLQSPAVTQKQIQNLIQPQKLKQQQITIQTFKPYVPNPVIPKPIVPFGLPFFQQGAGQQNFNRYLRKNKKPTPAYTSSLFNAEFQNPKKALKVTKEQLKALGQRTYSGLENRQLVRLVPDNQIIKEIKKVNF